MDERLPRQSRPGIDRHNSMQSKRSRDIMIHQYVQAARERLEVINASIGTAPAGTPPTSSHSTDAPNPMFYHPSSPSTPSSAHSLQIPTPPPQWPLRTPSSQRNSRRLQFDPEPELEPEDQDNRAAEMPPNRPSPQRHLPSPGFASPQQWRQNAPPPNLASNNSNYSNRPVRPGPSPKSSRGQHLRYPTAPRFASSNSRGPYRPPPNANPPPNLRPAPTAQQWRGIPQPGYVRPDLAASPENNRVYDEDNQRHQSLRSSTMTTNTLDVLSEYTDDPEPERPKSHAASNPQELAALQNTASDSAHVSATKANIGTQQPIMIQNLAPAKTEGVVRQASFGKVQKPNVTNIRSPSRAEKGSDAVLQETNEQGESPSHDDTAESSSESDGPVYGQAMTTSSPILEETEDTRGLASEIRNEVQPRLLSGRTSPTVETPEQSPRGKLTSHESSNASPLAHADSKFGDSPIKSEMIGNDSTEALNSKEEDANEMAVDSAYLSLTQGQRTVSSGGLVRESTTSLQGLILRNMKLASNLERGVTSSKFGIDWMLTAADNGIGKRQSLASISSMIDTFPEAPGAEKPPSIEMDERGAPQERQPPPMAQPRDWTEAERSAKSPRRCCSMPLWAFILVLVVIVLLIAAAIIIPVALIVIPSQSHTHTGRGNPQSNLASFCSNRISCKNNGAARVDTQGSCFCLCASGWTGPSCSAKDTSNCASIDLPGSSTATVGSNAASVIKDSKSKFNLGLNATELVALFYIAKTTCKQENNLVSFTDPANSPSRLRPRGAAPILHGNTNLNIVPTAVLNIDFNELRTRAIASTSNGIVVAPSPTISYPSSSSTSATPSPTSTSVLSFSQAASFSSTAVLYVLQSTSSMRKAEMAHNKLQNYLSETAASGSPYTNSHVELGYGWIANFATFGVYFHGF